MEKEIDSILFVEIIQTEGAREIRMLNEDGLSVGTYMGPSNKAVHVIFGSDEVISRPVAIQHLKDHGMSNLANALFPAY